MDITIQWTSCTKFIKHVYKYGIEIWLIDSWEMRWGCSSSLLYSHTLHKFTFHIHILVFQVVVKLCKSKARVSIWVYKTFTQIVLAPRVLFDPYTSTPCMVEMVTTRDNDVLKRKTESTKWTTIQGYNIRSHITYITWIIDRIRVKYSNYFLPFLQV